jgi:DNA recombination protein RmuC
MPPSQLAILALVAVVAFLGGYLLADRRRRDLPSELTLQFKALATEILDDKSRRFSELNKESLSAVLQPLQTDLSGFRQKVEEVYLSETRERSALAEQVRMLSELNGTLRDETTNLTRALKGDSKAQGDWGEMVLDQLLSNSGLLEGEHYVRQATQLNADGARVIPDVVLKLPRGRDLVVDSKVSLTAYSEFVAESDPAKRDALLNSHIASVKSHVKGLSEKRYQDLYQLTSVDFVLLFLPIEGAFISAVTTQRDLFQYAHERNVLLVSPSTFLFVVRTIAQVWRQEAQSKNALEIADRGAKLYDKFVAFTEDLSEVGKHLGRATDSYEDARRKLSEGPGNLVNQVKQLEALGVKGRKELPAG